MSVSSLKRWCDRGDLPTTKTAGGHRRISRAAVVRFLRERGFPAKRPDLLGLPAGTRLAARDATEVLPQLVDALSRGDEHHAVSVLTGLFLAKLSLAEISDKFIHPAFETIGRQWECGELEVYQEHRAVVVARNALDSVRSYLAAPAVDAPLAVSVTLSGDPYLLPISLIELALREAGWSATVLGPNHPADTLCVALEDIRPRLVCINVSYIPSEEALISDIRAVYETASELGIAVAIGGGRLNDDLRRKLPCTAHCVSMADLMSLARGLEPSIARGKE